MQMRGLDRGQAEGGGAGQLGAGQLDAALGLQGVGDDLQRLQHLGKGPCANQPPSTPTRRGLVGDSLQARGDRFGGPTAERIQRIGALHQVVGEGQVGHRAGERPHMVQALDERKSALARQRGPGWA